jgi:hypothetical protein
VSDQADGPVSKRGEAAWKEAKERVAERNEQARKAGKQRREASERQRDEARRVAEHRRMAQVLARHQSR